MKNKLAVVGAIGFLFVRMALGATEVITNGGFETLPAAPWVPGLALAGSAVPVVVSPGVAHGGNNYLSLGNAYGTNYQYVYQTINVPTNVLLARFSYFWGCSVGLDPAGVDVFSSVIFPNGGNAIYPDQHVSANSGFQPSSFDLTNYAGKTLQLGFLVQAAVQGVGIRTFFAIDDASLLLFTAADIPANDNFTNATLITGSSNVTVFATNVLATKEIGEPKHAGAVGGHSVWWKWVAPSNGIVTINTFNSSFDTVLAVYTGTVVTNLTPIASNDDQDNRNAIFTSQVRFQVTTGTEYEIAVDGKGGTSGTAQLNLFFAADTKAPTIKITSPKSGSKVTNSTVIVQGTATDNLAVSLVQYRLENAAGTNDFQAATGTNSWTATVTNLIPGPNTIRVRSVDNSFNVSSTAAVTVNFVVVSPLTVSITGTGTVTPNLNQMLEPVGGTLTLTAKPGVGQVFSNWTGIVTVTTPTLTFVMQSNMVWQANFVPNPFTPFVGSYQGLIFDTNGPTHAGSGFFSTTLASAGSFTAKIILAGQNLSLSGQFTAGGFFSNNIVRKGLPAVSAQLTLDLANGGITGLFNDGTFNSELVAARTVTTAGATAGKYTLLLPGGTDGVSAPGGDGYGTIVVSSTGAISLAGVLADGSKAAQKANLLTTGNWPFYVALYGGKGSVFGWLNFSNGVIAGPVDWFKLASAGGKLYPTGFTIETNAIGSVYQFTNGVPVINIPTGQVWFANGNLANSFTNQFALDTASKFTSTNATLKIAVTTSTGLVKGTVTNPGTGKAISFNGVVLQNQNYGGGFFTGTNQTGRVFLGP